MVFSCKQKQTKVLDDRQNGKRKQSGPKKCKKSVTQLSIMRVETPRRSFDNCDAAI